MWSNENRARYDRSRLRYPSDLTDAEWAHVEPLIPPARCGGNRRHVDVRQVVNGLMYVLSTGLPMARRPEGPAAALDALRLLRPLVPPPRLHPPHAAKTVQSHMKFPDRLLNTDFKPLISAGNLAKFGATWHYAPENQISALYIGVCAVLATRFN